MNKHIIERIQFEVEELLKSRMTIRKLAQKMNLSKSTVHKDLQERLLEIDKENYDEIQKIFQEHIKMRHINGGKSTKEKYAKKENRNLTIVE